MTIPSIRARSAEVFSRIADAAVRADRNPEDIGVVAVAKGRSPGQVGEVSMAGIKHLGVYAADEFEEKCLRHRELFWHVLGAVDRPDLPRVAQSAAMVQSIDGLWVAGALDKAVRFASHSRSLDVLIEVQLTPNQHGSPQAQVVPLARFIANECEHLRFRGLSCRRPASLTPLSAYGGLRVLGDEVSEALDAPISVLSMGDSRDYEEAIALGATHVRLGRALFG
ncbi:MAG: uncharacterized pyridoxal phosphate-containing UPF0001 family protein [Myxococcota bacterium]|jgi:uncharacterized pyridoxal phosphate-containing UPF0001 family protein